MTVTSPTRVLETVLYARDLDAIETFYRRVLGMEPFDKADGRQVFYRIGDQMLLIFNPVTTSRAVTDDAALPLPPHGADGEGHVCFRASGEEIDAWKSSLEKEGVPLEAELEWPRGGRSIYFRDPAGNCLEFAEPRIWGLE
ncbi:MAG: VOC family protein [Hyphomicrobium sp.]|jgi:catechol 2,3-dioxygenase-like lactoylglutathione lyase family enzyme